MDVLTDAQRNQVRQYLEDSGLTFPPLLNEINDHIISELEHRMADGQSFDHAWKTVLSHLPDNHFKHLQMETMESINKRVSLSRGVSYAVLGLLFCSTVFKILHLQFAGELLLFAFAGIAAVLLINSIAAINLYREKTGALRVLGVIAGVVILIAGYSFKVLHLPGADYIILLAVVVMVIAMVVNLVPMYTSREENDLLTWLHEKYSPGIDRFLILLLIPLTLYKMITLIIPSVVFTGNIILLVVIFGAGLQFIALNWRAVKGDHSKRSAVMLSLILLPSLCFVLPFLGPLLSFQVRVVIIVIFSFASAIVAFRMDSAKRNVMASIIVVASPVIFLVWGMLKLSLIPLTHVAVFNLPVMLMLTVGVFLVKRNSITQVYATVVLASYVFEYIA